MLVSVGACLIMIVSAYGFQHATEMPHMVLDPSRIAAQVVSGIGFLGAGSILLRGSTVRGMTTAASIWAVAAIGLACRGGMYLAAAVSTAIILLILAGLKPIEDAWRARVQSCVIEVHAEPAALPYDGLKKALRVRSGQIRRVVAAPAEDELERTIIHLVRVSTADIATAAARLKAEPGVRSVRVTKGSGARSDPVTGAAPD